MAGLQGVPSQHFKTAADPVAETQGPIASPDKLGRIDFIKVANYATQEGDPGEPRAILKTYREDNFGNVRSQNIAVNQDGLHEMSQDAMQDLAEGKNPHAAGNLNTVLNATEILDHAIETKKDLGYGVTPGDLQSVTAPKPPGIAPQLKMDTPGFNF